MVLVLLCGPSGSGKTKALEQLYKDHPLSTKSFVSNSRGFLQKPPSERISLDSAPYLKKCKTLWKQATAERNRLEGRQDVLQKWNLERAQSIDRLAQLKVSAQLAESLDYEIGHSNRQIQSEKQKCKLSRMNSTLTEAEQALDDLRAQHDSLQYGGVCPHCNVRISETDDRDAVRHAIEQWTMYLDHAVRFLAIQDNERRVKQLEAFRKTFDINCKQQYQMYQSAQQQQDVADEYHENSQMLEKTKQLEIAYEKLHGILVDTNTTRVQNLLNEWKARFDQVARLLFPDLHITSDFQVNQLLLSTDDRSSFPWYKLSSGEKARVILACEYAVNQPSVLFVDEILPSLDARHLRIACQWLRDTFDTVYVAAHLPRELFDEFIDV
jgi:ABC-type lipoprotein export system ATPase subunit